MIHVRHECLNHHHHHHHLVIADDLILIVGLDLDIEVDQGREVVREVHLTEEKSIITEEDLGVVVTMMILMAEEDILMAVLDVEVGVEVGVEVLMNVG